MKALGRLIAHSKWKFVDNNKLYSIPSASESGIFRFLVPVLLGVILGLTLFSLGMKEMRWPIGLVVVAAWVMILSMTENKKRFLLVSLFLAFTIQTDVNLWHPSPTLYHTGAASTTTAIELFAFDPPLILLLLFVIFSSPRNADHEFRKSDIAALVFVLACSLSFVNASHPELTIARLPVMLRMPLIYYCLSRGITSRKDLNAATAVLIFCVFSQSMVSILQTLFGSFAWLNRIAERTEQLSMIYVGKFKLGRAGGTIGYTTVLAQYLGMLSPLALVFFLSGTTMRQRLFAAVAYILSVIALIISLSRIEWACLPLVFVLVLGALVLFRKYRARALLKALSVLLVLSLLIALFSGSILARITESDEGSAYSRILLAKTALKVIISHPLFGIGLHNYTHAMHGYGSDIDSPNWDFGVHNSFLYVAAEIGLIGLLALLYLWLVTLKKLFVCLGKGDSITRPLSLGLLCGLIVLFLHSNVEQGFHIHQPLSGMLWSWFGIAAASRLNTIKGYRE